MNLCHWSDLLEMPPQVDCPGGECEVANVDGGGVGEGAYLSLGLAVVRAVPIQFFLSCVGIEKGGGAGRRRQD